MSDPKNHQGEGKDRLPAAGEPRDEVVENLYQLYLKQGMSEADARSLALANAEQTALYADEDWTF